MVRIQFTIHRRHLVAFTGMLVVAALLVPGVAWASHRFHDVPDSNVFSADIEWLADAGVTKGCNPPANDEFCPGNNVTREQMAAFMHRLALAGVVDAATLEGNSADMFAKAEHAPAFPVAGGVINGSDGSVGGDFHSWGSYSSRRSGTGIYDLIFSKLHEEIDCRNLDGALPVFSATPLLFDTRVTMNVDGWGCEPDTFYLTDMVVRAEVFDADGVRVDRSFSFIAYEATN